MKLNREPSGKVRSQRQAALTAIARQFSATWQPGLASRPSFTVAGHQIAIETAAVPSPHRGHGSRAKLRLRFDKVVVRLERRLQAALRDVVPNGMMVVVTVTAPIRVPAKTILGLENKVRALLRKPPSTGQKGTIHGNRVWIRFERTRSTKAPILMTLVHNAGSDPRILLEVTHTLLEKCRLGTVARAERRGTLDRWLVLLTEGDRLHEDACWYICSQLGIPGRFDKVLMLSPDGHVVSLGPKPGARTLRSRTNVR